MEFAPLRERAQHKALTGLLISLVCAIAIPGGADAAATSREILAFYYGWYGNPQVSGRWLHWKNVDPVNKRVENAADFPAYGAYDSHDRAVVDRQVEAARAAGITGFIASWWGRDTFEDRGMPILLAAAAKYRLSVSAYYENIAGEDTASRIKAAISDIDYLLAHYSSDNAWLRADGKPVLFVYGRALHELSPADWQEVIAQVRRDNPGGLALIADSLDRGFVSIFDGASTNNVTGQTQHKSPLEIRAWAHAAYPKMAVTAGRGKISTVTIIAGYDDRNLGRPPPRPVTERWDGETYRVLWQEAIAAAPDYILITSWNEWHEGSELEPSVEYGSRTLNETAGFSRRFLVEQR